MQELERISQSFENVIFDNSGIESISVPVRVQEPENIMDIPGTAHEKLAKLAEML